MTSASQPTDRPRHRKDATSSSLAVAAVARRRADEHLRLAHAAVDASETARQIEQHDHLLGLAAKYEQLASAPEPAVEGPFPPKKVRSLTTEGDPTQ